MKRREALKNILIASSSTVFLTSFTTADSGPMVQDGKLMLSKKYQKYLSQVSETFLPIQATSDKIDPVADFIIKMLNHSYQPSEINQFAGGFQQFLELMKAARIKVKSSEAEPLLTAVEQLLKEDPPKEDLVYFINTTKQLSIRNLTSSEYYITNFYQYKLIPGKYNGCLEVPSSN